MERVIRFLDQPFFNHLFVGLVIRLVLIVYAEYHDRVYDVPYTDVDYKVLCDAATHILDGNSPYKRHTFRYSPFLAYMLVPTLVTRHYGKILFSLVDILITMALKCIIEQQADLRRRDIADRVAKYCSLFWLYNPMSIAISTRGNADSVACFCIMVSYLYLQTSVIEDFSKYSMSGILLGFAIHLRLYPIVFTFPMYLSMGKYNITRNTSIWNGVQSLLPSKEQLVFLLSCFGNLLLVTVVLYIKYGYEFLFETYIYHLIRKDTRHNFSVLFYYSYLTSDQFSFDIVKHFTQILECVILFIVSLTFGCDPETLPFAMFSQAVVLVSFNSVMTSQYFVWFLSLLPLVIQDFKMRWSKALLLVIVWVFAQGGWLFYAYLLEFKSREVFILIWLKGIVFFCANIYILGQIIKSYSPGYAFGLTSDGKD